MRGAQRNAKAISYKRLTPSAGSDNGESTGVTRSHLHEISDAAFKREEETGHSMRGAAFVRCVGTSVQDMTKTSPGHLLDYVARRQRRVTRATFTSKLQGGCDTVDKGFLLYRCLTK